jgi:hypothetical protein
MKHFQLSLERSRQQGTLSWELRIALSIARPPSRDGHARTHRNLLRTVYDKFTEGHAAADLILAAYYWTSFPWGRLGLPVAKLHRGRRVQPEAGSARAEGFALNSVEPDAKLQVALRP